METYILIVGIIAVILLIIVILQNNRPNTALMQHLERDQKALLEQISQSQRNTAEETNRGLQLFGTSLALNAKTTSEMMDKRLSELAYLLGQSQEALQKSVLASLTQIQAVLQNTSVQNEQKLENIRETVEKRLMSLQEENGKKLDEMRNTVDEKLQKTLEERISKSFLQVSTQLEQVYKGLGEMQTLATGVGDLKKVLSNVKTRGILGEIQLGAILEQILSPEQYATNIVTKSNGRNPVEFAIKLPGDGETPVYLPIDSKFPTEDYLLLNEAYDRGDKAAIEVLATILERKIKSFAKDIHEKYVEPPHTTDFAILFLPIEGLYAEAVRRGLVETLQREYKVNIAGPTTMAALLNSLQMGFKTLAIQKRSSEVWKVLASVKNEFETFGKVLETAQNRITQTSAELDKLVGVRTRMIRSKLKEVSTLDLGVVDTGVETIETDEES
ncbi:MAG: DNA recombination protein RmuC [Erysipelotrichaceae bacterium]